MKINSLLRVLREVMEVTTVNLLVLLVAGSSTVFCIVTALTGILIGSNKRASARRLERRTSRAIIEKLCSMNSVYLDVKTWGRLVDSYWQNYKIWAYIEAGWFIIPIGLAIKFGNKTAVMCGFISFMSLKMLDLIEMVKVKQQKENVSMYVKELMKGEKKQC